MKVYIDLQKLAISKVVDATSPEYAGDINSNVFEILFFNFSGTNWFPTMSQLAPNGREAGDFEADALGQGETHDYTEDGISYKRYTFTMGDSWVLMKGISNLYIWYNVLEGSTLKKCVGKLNVMINESSNTYFISNPLFNPSVKNYIDSVASDIEDDLNDKIDAQNATIASLSQASPSVFDTTAHIQLLQENKGVAVATDTGYIWYWDTTITPNAYTNSNLQYSDIAPLVETHKGVIYFYPGSNVYITEKQGDKILFGYTQSMSMRSFNTTIYSKTLSSLATDLGLTLVTDSSGRDCIEIDTNYCLVFDNDAGVYALKTGNLLTISDYVILRCNQGIISDACDALLVKYFNKNIDDTSTSLNTIINNYIANLSKRVYFGENIKIIEKYNYNNSTDWVLFSFSSLRNRGFSHIHYNDSFSTIVSSLGVTPEVVDGVSYILLESNMVIVFNDTSNTYSLKARNNITSDDYVIIGTNQGQVTQCCTDYLNQYLKKYCDDKVIDVTPNLELPTNWKNKVNDIKAIQEKAFTIFLQTDTHFNLVGNTNTSAEYEYPMKVLSNYIYNDVSVNLGDIARGYTQDEPIEVVQKELTETIQRYIKCSNTPLLLARGNHDNGILSTDGPMTDDVLYAYLTKAVKKTTNIVDGGNFYYYKDFDNIRIIVLDTEDAEIKGINNHAISTTQLNWFNNVALNTDKSLIILSHCPLQQSLYLDTNYCVNMDEIVASLENYTGDVIACLSGHTHAQDDTKVNGINYIGFKNGGDYCNVIMVDETAKTIVIKIIGSSSLADRSFTY